MEDFENLPLSSFVGDGYAQHGGREWRKRHCVRYHAYLILDDHDLPDATAFARVYSIHFESKAGAMSVKEVGGCEGAGKDGENSEHERSGDNDEKISKLSDFILNPGIPEKN